MIAGGCVRIERSAFYEVEQNLDFTSNTNFKFFVRVIDAETNLPLILSSIPKDLIKVSTKEQNLSASKNELVGTSSEEILELLVMFESYAIPENAETIELIFETEE